MICLPSCDCSTLFCAFIVFFCLGFAFEGNDNEGFRRSSIESRYVIGTSEITTIRHLGLDDRLHTLRFHSFVCARVSNCIDFGHDVSSCAGGCQAEIPQCPPNSTQSGLRQSFANELSFSFSFRGAKHPFK